MQVLPSSGGWTNPAALSQQALNGTKLAPNASNRTASSDPVNRLEQSGKTSDRDANERYDGQSPANDFLNSNHNASPSENESMLSLPAADDDLPAILDIVG